MRKKIEELRNREEGFTLVELLAVIVILGIIVAIAIPAIGNVTQRAQQGSDKAEEQLIVDAARLYYTDNPKETEPVSTQKLYENGYIEDRGDGGIPVGTVTRTGDADTGYSYEYKKGEGTVTGTGTEPAETVDP